MGSGVIFQPGHAAGTIVEPSGSSLPKSPGCLGFVILCAAVLGHRNLGSRALRDWAMGSSRRDYSLVSRRVLLRAQPSHRESGASYVGWLLLAHAFLPTAPIGPVAALIRRKPNENWQMPPSIYLVAWVLMSLGYSYSGVMKLTSPSWLDGSALARILSNPLARPGVLRHWLLALPIPFLKAATWGALGLEVSFAPLALFRQLRPWIWSAMLCLHIGLFLLIAFPDLTAGMVFLHLFTFDPAWVVSSKWASQRAVPAA